MEFRALAQAQMPQVDPKNYKLDLLALRRICKVAKPFWWRRRAWPYWIVMGGLVLSAPALSLVMAYSSKVLADMTNAIVAKQVAIYWPIMWFFLALTVFNRVVDKIVYMIGGRLNLHWRRWLTLRLMDQYLARRTYYDITLKGDLDNPDQRIQETVGQFTIQIVNFPRLILGQLTGFIAGTAILASMDVRLIGVVIVYALVNAIVTYLLYSPKVKIMIERTIAEANFRYGLLHIRDNAETVAFYRGEEPERLQIIERLSVALKKNLIVIMYDFMVTLVSGGLLSSVWAAMPYLLLVPLYFSGHIQYGAIAQGLFAANQLLSALDVLTENIPTLASVAPDAVRLAEIEERSEALAAEQRDPTVPRLTLQSGSEIRLEHVSLQTPAGEQSLVQDLSLHLQPGDNLVVVGQTGVGKSSLLRAMAGLWSRGSGVISMPPPGQCLFLPQRPYMILADLRTQLCYPHECLCSDDELAAILDRVSLSGLVEKNGGWDAVRDWSKILSFGEQQRIAFARVLVARPEYVFLDEATSAVDYATEQRLYRLLTEAGCTFISIGHRVSILDHHSQALRLLAGGSWRLESIAQAVAHDEAAVVPKHRSDPETV